jgi:hypothetical protein
MDILIFPPPFFLAWWFRLICKAGEMKRGIFDLCRFGSSLWWLPGGCHRLINLEANPRVRRFG